VKNILVLSFFYPPDLSAGSFRISAFTKSISKYDNCNVDIITTLPNRYSTYSIDALENEKKDNIKITRIKIPEHKGGMRDQSLSFLEYSRQVLKLVNEKEYDLVYATSSKLMTATLGAYVAKKKKSKLYLDIRDIFVDTLEDILNPVASIFILPFIKLIEKWTFIRADKINLVSEGFKQYFKSKFPNQKLTFIPNGIDDIFLDSINDVSSKTGSVTKVLYAGNIGEGQGLHKIIPKLSILLESKKYHFKIIGDGGQKEKLITSLFDLSCSNVEVLAPVNRNDLLKEYASADILFLHLNSYKAFEKVLPSKIFEYAATGKPILAGVGGYASTFLNKYVENSAAFNPCDELDAIEKLEKLNLGIIKRDLFIAQFKRSKLMDDLVRDVVNTI